MDKAPKIYADWIKVLDVLKSAEDDENALALMEKERLFGNLELLKDF